MKLNKIYLNLNNALIAAKPINRILLLSHMRANTTLIGHIMGSHPEIEGYYELHSSYHNFRNLFKQRYFYYKTDKHKQGANFFFDKLLHNSLKINPDIFSENDNFIFSLRPPELTIPSIVNLYKKVDETHSFSNFQGANEYYIERLKGLIELSNNFKGLFYFYFSDDLRNHPEELTLALSSWLNLSSPLSQTYQKFNKTGKQGAGDSSSNIHTNKILPAREVEILEDKISNEALSLFKIASETLINNCHSFFDPFSHKI